jgi:hypothetical protein
MAGLNKPPNPLDQPHLHAFRALLDQLPDESPRGRVLISATTLDDLLQQILEARLVGHADVAKLTSGFNAPFGTFSARILGALALGTISEREYRELQTIRKIRNEFAHRMSASFDEPTIADRCFTLSYAAQDYGDVRVDALGRYTTAAVALILNLVNRAHYVGLKRLAPEAWPY